MVFFPEPDKVTAVTVAADSITTNSINLMITKPTGNPNSVIAVEPICESTAEDEQYPVCTGTEDEVVCVIDSLLRAGCSYTFKVRMICGKDEAAPSNRIYSAEVNLTSCISKNGQMWILLTLANAPPPPQSLVNFFWRIL